MDSKIFVYRIDLFFKVFLKSFYHFIFVLSWKWKISNFFKGRNKCCRLLKFCAKQIKMHRNLYTIVCWLHKHTTSRHAGKHIQPVPQVESVVSFCQLNVNGTMWKFDWTAETRSSSHISVFQDVWFWGTVGRAYRACPKSCICTIANSRAFPESFCFFTSLPVAIVRCRVIALELSVIRVIFLFPNNMTNCMK